jgi:hypothetical protein
MHGPRHALCLAVLTFVVAGPAHAGPWNFVGSRQQAMGGTGVAFTSDSTATYWNPANLAFQEGWGVTLPITLDGAVENQALTELSGLLVGFDRLDAAAESLFACQPACPGIALTPQQAEAASALLVKFAGYGQSGENVHVNASLGLAGRYQAFGLSAMSLSAGTIFPNTDLQNIALGGAVLDLIGSAGGVFGSPADGALASAVLAAADPTLGLDAAEAGHLVYLLERSGANTADPRVRQLATGLVAQGTGAGNFAANTTGALMAGLSLQEFGATYALKLPIQAVWVAEGRTRKVLRHVHDSFAVAVVPKYLLGVSFVKFFRYDDENSAGDIVKDLTDIENTRVSHGFGLDVAAAYRPTSWLRFGMMARNVNSPAFDVDPFVAPDGSFVSSIEVQPQVRVGTALVPIRGLTVAFDFDATSNRIVTLPGFASRFVSMGAEYAIPLGRHVDLALRLGGYSNVSSTVEDDWAMTGGLGLRFGSFHFDLSAGASFADELIQTGSNSFDTFPTRMNLGVGFSWEKSL